MSAEDPRILTPEGHTQQLSVVADIGGQFTGKESHAAFHRIESHDSAQRERIATLEAEIQHALQLMRDNGFSVMTPELDDALRQVLQAYIASRDNSVEAIRQLGQAKADNRRLREALEKLWKHTPQIDNGWCAVCRCAHRAWIHGKPSPCEDPRCPSHVIEFALQPYGKDGNGNQFANAGKMVQPAAPQLSGEAPTEQPRIWRLRNRNGILYHTGTGSEAEARHWQAAYEGSSLAYSIDGGHTWIDEQLSGEAGEKI